MTKKIITAGVRYFAVCIVFVFALCVTGTAVAQISDTQVNQVSESSDTQVTEVFDTKGPDDKLPGKIDAELREKMNEISGDEVITVWLWLKDLDENALHQMIKDETGFDPISFGYSENSRIDHETMDKYIESSRKITRREYSAFNNAFIEKNVPKDRRILYNSNYTSTLVVEATKDEILNYAKIDDVMQISLYVAQIQVPSCEDKIEGQIETAG